MELILENIGVLVVVSFTTKTIQVAPVGMAIGLRGMLYELTSKAGLLKPKAVLALENLGSTPLFNAEQGMRHPLAIYNFTFSEVVSKSLVLIDFLKDASDKLPHLNRIDSKWEERIIDATDHMLDAIIQHLDSFKSIICCFYPECSSKSVQKINRSLQREIRSYRDHVAKIVNLIKHKHRKLSTILFHGPGAFDLGYFVEGVLPNGTAGPDLEIHANSNVAISYNRDLPFHICNLYYCSAALAAHLHQICGVVPARKSTEPGPGDQLTKLLERVAAMPMQFFPDELQKPVPFVRLIPLRGTDHFNVTIEFPSRKIKPRMVPEGVQDQVNYKGDGVTNRFKMPYYGEKEPSN